MTSPDLKPIIIESLLACERIAKLMNDRELAILSTKSDPHHLKGQRKDSDMIRAYLGHCALLSQYSIDDIKEVPQGRRLAFPIDQAFSSGKTGAPLILEIAIMLANHIRSQIQTIEKLDDTPFGVDICPNCSIVIDPKKDQCPQCGIWLNIINETSGYKEGFELDL